MPSLCFPYTNESLASLIAGMDVQPDDEILAICGSGDQAFALVEYAKRVVAVDNDPAQIIYAKRRKEKLKQSESDLEGFLDPDHPNSYKSVNSWREAYFRKKGRFEKIRKKNHSLDIREGDFFDILSQKKNFTKLYLSNILDYPHAFIDSKEMINIVAAIPKRVLLYMVCFNYPSIYPFLEILKPVNDLTQKARKFSGQATMEWTTLVYRKI